MTEPLHFDDQWSEEVVLRDGSAALLRTVRPSDIELLRDGFRRLSPQSRYLRFLGARTQLSDEELRYLSEVDGVSHFALGAVRVDAIGREEGLGVARFVRLDDEREVAEPALTVVDDEQGKGLGTILLHRLIEAAIERGVVRFRCDFLADNLRVQELFRDVLSGFPEAEMQTRSEGGVVRAEMALSPLAEIQESIPRRLTALPLAELLGEVARGRLVARLGRALLKWPGPPESDEA